ncbi:MAG TPA: ATP-binding protein [Candidatus Pacearchaeota archaeon]|nr:archaeal ATPase [archaeon BMS3Abin17]HDK42012.1 ATP-binding protein [Candidatus Pacearchaeota archaeon]HDZ60766.1 ATP-binding protein [Candidatus Pacearchaeota archaeon]
MKDRKYKRKITDEILKYLKSREVIVIYGSRQVGKTTLVKYIIENHLKENAFYFDLELKDLLDLCNEGPESVYKYLIQKGANDKKKIYLIIDEIQYLENPSNFLKIMHDHYENVKLIVSGPSTFEIKKKFKESLVGRTVNFELYPLSFEEFLIFKNKNYQLKTENTKAINDELIILAEEYIKFGGYPKIVLERLEEKKLTYLSQIINTYIRKDIRDIGNIRNISSFNKLIEILASQSGQLLNILELSNTLNINRETISEYLDLLENTFIIKRISPFHKNLRSELSKNPKIYFLDTGMMNLLWFKEFPKVILGNVFETFVFLELMKSGEKIKFWRTTNKQEVDFVLIGRKNKICGIEVKYNFDNSDIRNLKSFTKEYNCRGEIIGLKGKKSGKYIWELIKG